MVLMLNGLLNTDIEKIMNFYFIIPWNQFKWLKNGILHVFIINHILDFTLGQKNLNVIDLLLNKLM